MSKLMTSPAAVVWLLVAIVLGVGIVRLTGCGIHSRSSDQQILIDKSK